MRFHHYDRKPTISTVSTALALLQTQQLSSGDTRFLNTSIQISEPVGDSTSLDWDRGTTMLHVLSDTPGSCIV